MKYWTTWLILVGACLLIAFALFILTRDPISEPLVANPAGWQANQPVSVNPPDPTIQRAWEERFPEFGEVIGGGEPLRIYYQPASNGAGLQLASPAFPAPEYVSLLVTGDLHRPGNRVYLERSDNRERFFVVIKTGLRYWQRATYHMPASWIGQPVRLMVTADANPDSEVIGISNLRALNRSAVLRSQLAALAYLPAYVVALVLFIAPGLAASLWLAWRMKSAPILVVPLAVVGSSLVGYLEFWATVVDPSLHRMFAWAVAVAGPIALVWVARRRSTLLRSDDVRIPLALWMLIGLFYLAITFSIDLGKPGAAHTTTRFLDEELSIDAHLPSLFAHELSRGPVKLPMWVLNWRSSDRPPLQTGIALLQRPIAAAAGLMSWALYLPLAVALQCAWVPALWAVFRAMGLSHRRSGITLVFLVLSGFVFVNSAFVWPKMLSAALTLAAILFGLFEDAALRPWFRAVVIGLAAALAVLAHGGAVFTLLPLGAMLLLPRWSPGLAMLLVAGASLVALWLPWSYYQSLDPPGDRLIKMHLAGAAFDESYKIESANQVVVDYRFRIGDKEYPEQTPAWRVLLAAYGRMSLREILEDKWANLRVIFFERADMVETIHQSIPNEPFWTWRGFRRREFFNLFWGLGLLNVGWVVIVAGWRKSIALGTPVSYLVASSLVCWLLLMFGPGTTVLHQGPYATFLMLFGLLAAGVSTLPRYAVWLLLGAQGVLFTAAWLLTSAVTSYALMNPVMIFLAAAFFFGLLHQALKVDSLPAEDA